MSSTIPAVISDGKHGETHLLASSTMRSLRSFKLCSLASGLVSHPTFPFPFPSVLPTGASACELDAARLCSPSRVMSEAGVLGVETVAAGVGATGAGGGGAEGSTKKPAGGCEKRAQDQH